MTDLALKETDLYARAYAAVDAGELEAAVPLFGRLAEAEPDNPAFQYMLGLVHKYRFEWAQSLACNLRALALFEGPDEATLWNAGIAATGLGDWSQARQCWEQAGIRIAPGTGPVLGNFGRACVRLNAWDEGETLWASRLDPCRARIENVPYPESGYRFGDVVLHDGASTGRRESHGRTYPVLNVFQRLERSPFDTFEVELTCPAPEDIEELLRMQRPGIGLAEDWTSSVRALCRQCSLGIAHDHHDQDEEQPRWNPERHLGLAAQAHSSAERLLRDWAAAGPGRKLESITRSAHEPGAPADGFAWWRGADEDEEEEHADQA